MDDAEYSEFLRRTIREQHAEFERRSNALGEKYTLGVAGTCLAILVGLLSVPDPGWEVIAAACLASIGLPALAGGWVFDQQASNKDQQTRLNGYLAHAKNNEDRDIPWGYPRANGSILNFLLIIGVLAGWATLFFAFYAVNLLAACTFVGATAVTYLLGSYWLVGRRRAVDADLFAQPPSSPSSPAESA